eukprot:g15211.t1
MWRLLSFGVPWSPGVLPEDLRRQLTTESPELAETVLQHVRRGGWKRSTPSTLPQEGSEDAVAWPAANVGFAGCVAAAVRNQVSQLFFATEEYQDVVMSPLVLPFELVVAGLLWSLAVVLLLGGASAVAVWDCAQLIKTKRIQWHRQKGLEDAVAACEPSKDSDALVKDLSQVEGPADCSVEAEKPVTLRMEELQAKHQEELREKDLKLEEMQKELEEKKAEGLELWEDAKKQRREANRLQSFAISATNSLRKMQREVRVRGRDAQEELAQLREWLSAPSSGAKDEHRQIAGLRDEVKEWKSTYKKDKASWMRAICELTKQRDQHVARADVLAKQLGQWREIFQETDLLELEHQDWSARNIQERQTSRPDELGTKQDESCQNSPQVFYISSPRSEARSSSKDHYRAELHGCEASSESVLLEVPSPKRTSGASCAARALQAELDQESTRVRVEVESEVTKVVQSELRGQLKGFASAEKKVAKRLYSLEDSNPRDSTLDFLKTVIVGVVALGGSVFILAAKPGPGVVLFMTLLGLSVLFVDQVINRGFGELLLLDSLGRAVSKDYPARVACHEAGHFLVAYLLGILPKAYTLSAWEAFSKYNSMSVQAGTVFLDQAIQSEMQSGQVHNGLQCARCGQVVCVHHRFEDQHPCVDLEAAVKKALAEAQSSLRPEEFSEAVRTLTKIFDNILSQPKNAKFRSLRKENAVVKEKLKHPSCLASLRLCGFVEDADVFVCPDSVDLSTMRRVCTQLKAVPLSEGVRLVDGVIVRPPKVEAQGAPVQSRGYSDISSRQACLNDGAVIYSIWLDSIMRA